eukprot:1048452-Pelagomonas_calceolata.AAC.1
MVSVLSGKAAAATAANKPGQPVSTFSSTAAVTLPVQLPLDRLPPVLSCPAATAGKPAAQPRSISKSSCKGSNWVFELRN